MDAGSLSAIGTATAAASAAGAGRARLGRHRNRPHSSGNSAATSTASSATCGWCRIIAGSPTLKLKLSAFVALFEESARQTRNDNFGLWFGNQFQPRDLGMWGYAAVSAPTLGSALENLVGLFRYHQESSAMRLVTGSDGLARLEYQITAPSIVERRQDAELSLGMFLNFFREACGASWAPEEVHFEHPKPAEREGARGGLRRAGLFLAADQRVAFPAEYSRAADAGKRPEASRDHADLPGADGHEGRAEDLLLDRVRTAVRLKLPEGCPTLEDVAEELHVPDGAICRELHDAGTSYKELVEGVRRDLAVSYMRQRRLPFSEMAMLLGLFGALRLLPRFPPLDGGKSAGIPGACLAELAHQCSG